MTTELTAWTLTGCDVTWLLFLRPAAVDLSDLGLPPSDFIKDEALRKTILDNCDEIRAGADVIDLLGPLLPESVWWLAWLGPIARAICQLG